MNDSAAERTVAGRVEYCEAPRAEWLTLTAAQSLYSIPVGTWRRWIRERLLGYSKPGGGRLLLCRREIEELLERHRRGPRESFDPRARVRPRAPTIDPESVLAKLAGQEGAG